jgi:hypothetical protein
VNGRRFADDTRASRRGSDEVCFAFDGGRAGAVLEIRHRGKGTKSIPECHDRPSVQNGGSRTELRPDGHFGDKFIRLGADQIDA